MLKGPRQEKYKNCLMGVNENHHLRNIQSQYIKNKLAF